MKIKIIESAINDLRIGYDFYERQGKGLGWYFWNSLFSDIESLEIYAGIHRKVFNFHRMLSKKFPVAIYYKIKQKTIIIYAVLDCRQNPEKLKKRLDK